MKLPLPLAVGIFHAAAKVCRACLTNFKYKTLLLGVFLTYMSGDLVGQGTPDIIPPSPNAAAFSKYGNVPVSPYTGVPNIDIPIYEISIRDIKVPISLSYHAGGIRVGDEASRVGLGWVLNAGGLISREIVNRDDLQALPDAFLHPSSPAIPQGPVARPAANTIGGTVYSYYSTQGQSGVPINIDLTPFLVPTGIDPMFRATDFEPDQFTYNFLGYTGGFVLNKAREVIMEKQEKIRIRPITPDGATWEITTPDGFVYKFLDSEFFIDTDNTPGYQQKSAWYLSEIISPQNEHVYFYYTSSGSQYVIPVGSFYERWAPRVLSCFNYNCRPQNHYRHPIVGKNYSNISLDRIEWSHGKIKFNMADDRLDIAGDRRITSIQIFKKDATEPYEEVVFSHDYFTSPTFDPLSQYDFPTDKRNEAIKRLKLNGLTRRSLPNSVQPEQWFFSYYEPNYIPGKNSFSRDHWGYFNGKGNTSLVPSYKTVITGTPFLKDFIGVMGTERDPAADHVQMLSLKSITYPTKGTTTFYYSANEYEVDPNIPDDNEPEAYPETTPFIYDASAGNKGTLQSKLLDLTDEYVNNEGKTVPVVVRGGFRTNMTVACNQMVGTPNIYFEVFNEAGASFGRVSPNGVKCASPTDPECPIKDKLGCITCCSGSMFFDYTGSLVLAPGKYYWKAFMEASEAQIVDISAQFTWLVDAKKRPQFLRESDGSIKRYRTGGGLRISKIEDYDPDGNQKVNVRKFVYGYKTNTAGVLESHSYGKRMVKPAYSYFDVSWEETVAPITGTTTTCLNCYTLIRDSGHPLANYNGNSVGYDKVIEYFGENGENGYTEYQYENVADQVKNYVYPYAPDDMLPIRPPSLCTIKNPGNGNLKFQTHFNSASQKVSMTENIYRLKFNNVMYGLNSREIPIDPGISPSTAPFFQILSIYEAMNSNFSYLSETIVTSYLPTGEEATKTRTEYFYDKGEHLQLTKKITYESDLNKTVTQYTYPADYTDAQSTAAIMSMKGAKFMHALPVETTVIHETSTGTQSIKNREFTIYENFGSFTFPKERLALQNTTLLTSAAAPAYIPSGTYNAALYQKLFTLEYNASGNVKKIQKPFDASIAYLWGHNQTLPVAEIKNGTAEESFYTSFEEDGTVFASAGLNMARTGIKVKVAASYTFPAEYTPVASNTLMSYWYWQNSKWNFSGIVPFQRTITTAGTQLDEIRAFPKGARMTTFNYLPILGLSSKSDENNTTIYYEYDEMSRLKLIRDNNKKILKSYEYSYKK